MAYFDGFAAVGAVYLNGGGGMPKATNPNLLPGGRKYKPSPLVQRASNTYWQRPPLTADEITLMPYEEIIELYYNLARYSCGKMGSWSSTTKNVDYDPNPVVSAGIDTSKDKLISEMHEHTIRDRIYNTRVDMQWVYDRATNKTVPFLVNLSKVRTKPDHCGMNWGGVVIGLASSVATFGAGTWIAVIQTALSVAKQVASASAIAKRVRQFQRLQSEVAGGMSAAQGDVRFTLTAAGEQWIKGTIQEPFLTERLSRLVKGYYEWNREIDRQVAAGAITYEPYRKYFYSDTVQSIIKDFIDSGRVSVGENQKQELVVQAVTPQYVPQAAVASKDVNDAIGAIGVGLFLFLL